MEIDFIAWLRNRIPQHPRLLLGPGDDAAVLQQTERADCVITTDLLSDGVHFRLAEHGAERAGRKALGVNLSDLAAMAAVPTAAVVSLLLPRRSGRQIAERLYAGMLPLAEQFDLAIAGGDTNSWDGPLVISVTALGEVTAHGALLRSGAQAGDWIITTGAFGGSILGHHLDFTPRVSEALRLNEKYELHAAIDVSDGLSLDLARLVEESHCGAELDLDTIPVTDAARRLVAANNDSASALDHALSDGEDFELVLAVPPDDAQRMLKQPLQGVPLTRIGRFINESGLWQRVPHGVRRPLDICGFQHSLDE